MNLPPLLLAGLVAWSARSAMAGTGNPEPSFRRDILQVLSKSGCNAGPCHGNANGKGGFKLSLRGEDPAADFTALVLEQSGRRLQPLRPEDSLLLLKATGTLAHEGGRRFGTNAWEYERLRAWIAGGASDDGPSAAQPVRLEVTPQERFAVEPVDHVDIRAVAVFPDGSRRDVTTEAVYESSDPRVTVRPDGRVDRAGFGETVLLVRYLGQQAPARIAFVPARPGFAWKGPRPANYIDREIFAKLERLRMNPSPVCSDSVFVRRAFLDLLGALPTAEEARAFVSDRSRQKRAALVDRLLERPEFADFQALKWADLLRVEERTLDRKGMSVFQRWIRDSFAANRPLDVFARDLLAARGSTYANPAANFYRASRTPVERATAVGQVFLGTRLTCAQCHNHPFDRWTQDDYHDWAAVFGRVGFKVLRNDRRDENDAHEFVGEQVVYVAASGNVDNPRTGKPAVPRWLGSGTPLGEGDPLDGLDRLAKWVTSPTNRVFARVQANRVWSQLMGRGLVDPVDDFRATNPPTHPALLEALADDLVKHRFDLRHLIRRIMASRTYQLESLPNEGNADDVLNHSHAVLRRLGAEVLLDAQHRVAGVPFESPDWPDRTSAVSLPGGAQIREYRKNDSDRFLDAFGKPPRVLTCDCERTDAVTLSQTLQLISGPVVNRLLSSPENRLSRMAASGRPPAELVTELYWTALTRDPSPSELERSLTLVSAGDRRAGLEDVAWSLINSKEFILRR